MSFTSFIFEMAGSKEVITVLVLVAVFVVGILLAKAMSSLGDLEIHENFSHEVPVAIEDFFRSNGFDLKVTVVDPTEADPRTVVALAIQSKSQSFYACTASSYGKEEQVLLLCRLAEEFVRKFG